MTETTFPSHINKHKVFLTDHDLWNSPF